MSADLPQIRTAVPSTAPIIRRPRMSRGWTASLRRWLFSTPSEDELSEEAHASTLRFRNICVSRETGAGGSQIARMIADRLGWSLFDDNLVETIAAKMGTSVEEVQRLDELAPSPIQEWFLPLREEEYAPLETFLDQLAEMLETIGQKGQCVVVGRGASHMLPRDETLVIHIVAPLKSRGDRVAERSGVQPRTGRRMARELDRRRNRFLRTLYQVNPRDLRNYDFVLNSSTLGIPMIVDIVVQAVKLGFRDQVSSASGSERSQEITIPGAFDREGGILIEPESDRQESHP